MSTTNRVHVKLVEYESMLHSSVQRVGRAVRNLEQEMAGFGSRTPASGEPGGGKGAGPTVFIVNDDDDQDEGESVPTTGVEVQALGFARPDTAARDLGRLNRSALDVARGLAATCSLAGLIVSGPSFEQVQGVGRLVVFDYAMVRKIQRVDPADDPRVLRQLRGIDRSVGRVYRLCQAWGYKPGVPTVAVPRADLLAIDMTEQWCTSHLRLGDKRPRSRGELCDWCYRNGPLLVATWSAPPVELVRLHVDNGKVYAHQVEPFLAAERDRQRNLARGKS